VAKSEIQLVCFDLGGVLLRICRSWAEGCAAAGVEVRDEAIRDASRDERHDLVVLHQTGKIDGPTYFRRVSEAVGGLYTPEEVRRVHHAWVLEEYPGVGAVIDRIHEAGLATAALSNTNHEHWVGIQHYPVMRKLRHRHASHLMGLHKPDPAIYRAFERAAGRRGGEILFFDDLPENIAAAEAVGWRAIGIDPLGDTARQLADALAAQGVLSRR
jgi:putative hydrolase of the HAD superfamily